MDKITILFKGTEASRIVSDIEKIDNLTVESKRIKEALFEEVATYVGKLIFEAIIGYLSVEGFKKIINILKANVDNLDETNTVIKFSNQNIIVESKLTREDKLAKFNEINQIYNDKAQLTTVKERLSK